MRRALTSTVTSRASFALARGLVPLWATHQFNALTRHQTRSFFTGSLPLFQGSSFGAADAAKPATGTSHEHDVSILDAEGNAVQVEGLTAFADLTNAPGWLLEGLRRQGYPSTTDIQKYTIPLLDKGNDIIGLAPTGSGKTVAFAVPALKRLQRSPDGTPGILVLAPTRELVQQTSQVFQNLASRDIRVCEAYGGAPREIQARRLHSGCDVLVACPGRLKDFLDSGDVSIKNVSFLVFDEADRLLDMGFQIQLDEILAYLDNSTRPQTMMWSATWPRAVQDLARNYLSPERVTIRAGTAGTGLQVNEHIKQHVFFVNRFPDRIEKLAGLIDSGEIDDSKDKLIIFVERQSDTENAAYALSQRLGIDTRYVGVIHGGLSQRQRDRVMGMFKRNDIRLLVATDVASRGLDIPDVTCVVNFQAPKNIDSYCHRIGRTGRAGRTGTSYTFVGDTDGSIAADLEDYLARCGSAVPPELTEMAAKQRQVKQRFGGGRGRSNPWSGNGRFGGGRSGGRPQRRPQRDNEYGSSYREDRDSFSGW